MAVTSGIAIQIALGRFLFEEKKQGKMLEQENNLNGKFFLLFVHFFTDTNFEINR